jgi:hypothetical protein
MLADIIEWTPGQPLPAAFTELPGLLYKGDPHWIPVSVADMQQAFDIDANPYCQSNTAKAWVEPGKCRLAGFYDPQVRIEGEKVAYFGFWETVNDVAPNAILFARFEQWALQCGAARVYGPINFNTFNRYRIRLNLKPGEGCFAGEPYNPVYYKDLLDGIGYGLDSLYISQYIPESEVEDVYRKKEGLKNDIARLPYRFQYLTTEFWLSRLPHFYKAIDIIFGNNFAYTPISWEQFQVMYGPAFAEKLCPKLSVVVLNDADEIVAFSLGFPDYAPLCNQGSANPIPYSQISYREHFNLLQSPTFLLRTAGVLPGFRRQDLMNAMGIYAMFNFRKYYSHSMACLMKEDNFSTNFFRDANHIRREYGLFKKSL